jgi:hypothetical protein
MRLGKLHAADVAAVFEAIELPVPSWRSSTLAQLHPGAGDERRRGYVAGSVGQSGSLV